MMSRISTPRRARRRTIRRRMRIGPTLGRILAVGAIAILGIVALTQSAGRESAVYASASARNKEGALQQEVSDLKVLEERAKTLDRISQAQVKTDMVPVGGDVQYLNDQPGVAGAATTKP